MYVQIKEVQSTTETSYAKESEFKINIFGKEMSAAKSQVKLFGTVLKIKICFKNKQKIFKKNINKISHEEELYVVIKKVMKLVIKLTS